MEIKIFDLKFLDEKKVCSSNLVIKKKGLTLIR